ncbi:hypothetical protein ACN47E_009889 [Coniothyrium glycines]
MKHEGPPRRRWTYAKHRQQSHLEDQRQPFALGSLSGHLHWNGDSDIEEISAAALQASATAGHRSDIVDKEDVLSSIIPADSFHTPGTNKYDDNKSTIIEACQPQPSIYELTLAQLEVEIREVQERQDLIWTSMHRQRAVTQEAHDHEAKTVKEAVYNAEQLQMAWYLQNDRKAELMELLEKAKTKREEPGREERS